MSSPPAPSTTALLLIDPYNDFIAEGGKAQPRLAESLIASNTVAHLKAVVAASRKAKIPIFYGLHQQMHAHSFLGWSSLSASQKGLKERMIFEEGSWGAQIYEGLEPDWEAGDVVVSKHWGSSSFQNTDLDYQLRKRGITKVAMAGLVANTCLESTARYAYELGYAVTMLTDATAGFTTAAKDAATSLIWPLFADEVVTSDDWIQGVETK
ncbi:hypothetical protein MMC10_008268 [Thelotrema lepadinum]|nr:hypothetical protein [Thelotrema lepadinum]